MAAWRWTRPWGGGYPKGRIIEIYGPEASGKTTLAMHAAAEVQKAGGEVVYIDVEHAFDGRYASELGINIVKLGFCQPSTGEQALEIMDELCRSGGIDLVVIDSVAALVPRAELEGEIGAPQIGMQARLLSQALRKLATSAAKHGTTLIFINQIRNKVGVLFGTPETTSGGMALKYYSSIRIDVRKKETITTGDVATANKVRAKVVKNKVAPPLKEAIFDIVFGKGIDFVGGMVEAAVQMGVVQKRGSWCFMGEERLCQGQERLVAMLRADPAKRDEVERAVRAVLDTDPEKVLVDIEGGASDADVEALLDLDALQDDKDE